MSRLIIPDQFAASVEAPWTPKSAADRSAVKQQLERILGHPSFRNSKRYPNLLRYIVEQTLRGEASLKERVLGVEVFGRAADYDTNEDPIVRITAGEIRRRIAQYYHESGRESEIRIDLPAGSYVPVFRLPPQGASTEDSVVASALAATQAAQEGIAESPSASAANEISPSGHSDADLMVHPAASPERERGTRSRWLMVACVVIPSLAICGFLWTRALRGNTLDRFWSPVINSKLPVLICIPDLNSVTYEAPQNAASDNFVQAMSALSPEYKREKVSLSDSLTMAMLAGLLVSRGADYRVRRSEDATLQDLKDGPVVLIAGGNNRWTVQLNKQLRFTSARDGEVRFIRDAENPSSQQWAVNGPDNTPNSVDYGIISRVFDANTGGVLVTAAGLHHTGTQAVGECITDARCLAAAEKMAPGDWSKANIQIVIETKIIGETPAQPSVVAARVW